MRVRRHDAGTGQWGADIVEVSVRLRVQGGHPQLESIGHGPRNDQLAAPVDGFEFVTCPSDDFELVGRVRRAKRDNATGTALAVEQRLGPLENLDLRQIEHATVESQTIAERQAVEVERNRLIDSGIL